MVFAPVDPAIREKIIALYSTGKKGRNQIDRELRKQGVKVSHGSISNFINAHKREQSLQSQPSISKTVELEIRDKVIKMAQENNLGRNALAKTLQLEGIKVSSGSISKILKESKESRISNTNTI